MRKWTALALATAMLLVFSGCNGNLLPTEEPTDPVESTPSQTESVPTEPFPPVMEKPITTVSVPIVTKSDLSASGQEIFIYSYPHMSMVLQDTEVADKVILDFLNRVDATAATAETLRIAAMNAYAPSDNWIPHSCRVQYDPVRIDQGVLSLTGTISTFSGGVHPDHIKISASYDLLTGDLLTLGSILQMNATMQDLCDLVLEALEPIASKLYLYSDYTQTVNKRFSRDASYDEDFYLTPTGLCFYFSPYEIAPYSSGIITVEIPYEKLVGILLDGYFPGETHLTSGTMTLTPFQDADMEKIQHISEAILTPGAEMYLLTATDLVNNVRLRIVSNDGKIQEHTFFAAETLSAGNAIMIQATPKELSSIELSYANTSGTQIIRLS